jgi:hypothetical protein
MRRFIHELTEEAETAAGQHNMKRLYEITRTLSGKTATPPDRSKTRTEKPSQERRTRG